MPEEEGEQFLQVMETSLEEGEALVEEEDFQWFSSWEAKTREGATSFWGEERGKGDQSRDPGSHYLQNQLPVQRKHLRDISEAKLEVNSYNSCVEKVDTDMH